MRLVDYDLFELPGKSQLLRLETADGTVGWGEPTVEGKGPSTRAAVAELVESVLLGEDPLDVEGHWQRMYRGGFYRGGPVLMSAIAGVDQALWDIKGKHYGAPIYELLGGKARDRIQLYRWLHGERPEEIAADAEEAVAEGFEVVKMNAVPAPMERVDSPAAVARARDRVTAAREAVGDEVDLGVDFHGRVSKPMAKRLAAALEPAEPMFIEEPLLPEHNDALPDLAASTTIPIATGERMFSRWDFKRVFESRAVDVIQPDLSHAGGITEVKKIAAMGEAYDAALAPHCPLGPVALAACLQVDACSPNALVQEQSCLDGGVAPYVANPDVFDYDDRGFVDLPSAPGLGVEIDEDAIGSPDEETFKPPEWRHDDGSVAEW
jgi:galactonate dehydratase